MTKSIDRDQNSGAILKSFTSDLKDIKSGKHGMIESS